jgi:hypothetical protein
MITDDQLEGLPDGDLEAFVAFEPLLRAKVVGPRNTSKRLDAERDYAVYMIAFTEARNIDLDVEDAIPASDSDFKVFFERLMSRVDVTLAIARMALANQRKKSDTTFHIGISFKTQIGGHLTAIRKIVQEATLSDAKREAIFNRIEKLQAEVNRDRTKTETAVGLWLDITSAISHGAERLDPAIDRLERIMKVFAEARDEDTATRLPAPPEQKRIPPPKAPQADDVAS